MPGGLEGLPPQPPSPDIPAKQPEAAKQPAQRDSAKASSIGRKSLTPKDENVQERPEFWPGGDTEQYIIKKPVVPAQTGTEPSEATQKMVQKAKQGLLSKLKKLVGGEKENIAPVATLANNPEVKTKEGRSSLKLIDWLEKNALAEEGVLRLSGTKTEADKLQETILRNPEKAAIPADFKIVSTVLKAIIEKQQLISGTAKEKYLQAGAEGGDEDAKTALLKQMYNELPPEKRAVLKAVIELSARIASQSDTNKMKPTNLAVTPGVTLYTMDMKNALNELPAAERAFVLMLKNKDQIFQ